MKLFVFRSICTRIMTTTTLVIVALVGGVILRWANSESRLYRQQKVNEAKLFALTISEAWSGKLIDQDWSEIRNGFNVLMNQNEDVVYIIMSDRRLANQIVAASPSDFHEQYIPDIVPVPVTEKALVSPPLKRDLKPIPVVTETFILRDIEYPKGQARGKRGERVIEVSSDVIIGAGERLGTVRVGISLRQVDRAVADAVKQALAVGALGLAFGLVSAYLLARRLSDPVQRLQMSAAKIAAGDLQHRAEIYRADEIGALANSFNVMSAALQASFNKLQKTLVSFERFVPNKFLAVIAPEGIENIQVGAASIRKITILFSDIRGYTSMSEQMTPPEIFSFLNEYLACMGEVIEEAGGFIDKYIGDAIMALFDDEATDGALRAAIAMQQSLLGFNEIRRDKGLPMIAIGIGIHRGEVIMGTVGFTSRIESTVIGDAVNLASRVEGLTKNYNCKILVTESAVAALRHPEAFKLRLVDKAVKVKGKDEAIALYELQMNSKG